MAGRILRDSPENQRKMSAKERKLETIFDILKEKGGTYGVVAALAKKTGYSHQTLYRWRCQLRLNPAWRPYRCHYGQHRRAFTDLEELELVGRIKDEYLDKGLFYSDQDFIYDAQAFFAEVIQRPGDRASLNMNFQCTHTFVREFRKRHAMSLRRPTLKRRPTVTKEQIENFRARVRDLKNRYPENLIFNMDETSFRRVNMKHLTWALKGANAVNCYNQDDVRQAVTVLATINLAREKLPLMVVGKGTTDGCLKKFGHYLQTGQVWSAVSSSGWTKESVMERYLRTLHSYTKRQPCALILDVYPAHRTDHIKALAAELQIELVFIPPGCTDACQPLDIAVFAVLKAHAKRLWRQYYHEMKGERLEWITLMDHLVESWDLIDEKVIANAWNMYNEFQDYGLFDDDSDDNDDAPYIPVNLSGE